MDNNNPDKPTEVYCELGQRILNLIGIDDDAKNVLIDLLERIEDLKNDV